MNKYIPTPAQREISTLRCAVFILSIATASWFGFTAAGNIGCG